MRSERTIAPENMLISFHFIILFFFKKKEDFRLAMQRWGWAVKIGDFSFFLTAA